MSLIGKASYTIGAVGSKGKLSLFMEMVNVGYVRYEISNIGQEGKINKVPPNLQTQDSSKDEQMLLDLSKTNPSKR